jgi:N-dimethylarginine dimethylaminohydrolase
MKEYGCQSMVGKLERVLVKHPGRAFKDEQKIALEWEALGFEAPPDLDKAEKEFEVLTDTICRNGAEILFLPEDDRTTLDSIYTHDPVIVTEAGAVILRMGKEKRRGEEAAIADFFTTHGVPILGRLSGDETAEGGDLLWLDRRTLVAGRSFRTNAAGIQALRRLLEPLGVKVVDFDLPCWRGSDDVLHLMSLLSLVDRDLAVCFSKLLPVSLFELLEDRGVGMIDVPEEEFLSQGSNVLALEPRRVIILEGNPRTRAKLEAAGCEVYEIKGDEIAFKGKGGPTCLTRPLLRASD